MLILLASTVQPLFDIQFATWNYYYGVLSKMLENHFSLSKVSWAKLIALDLFFLKTNFKVSKPILHNVQYKVAYV